MARRQIASGAVLLVVSLVGRAGADANGLIDSFGPRELALGESMRADSPGAMAITLNPAGLGLSSQLVFEGTYGHRGSDGADSVAVSACDSTVPVPGCFYYHYFAAEPSVGGEAMSRRAHEVGLTLSRRLSDRVFIGVTNKYFDYKSNLTGEEGGSGYTVDAGLLLRASSAVSLAAVGYNLFGATSINYPRAAAVGLAIKPTPALSLGADALWDVGDAAESDTSRYGGGIEWFLASPDKQAGFPLRGGVVYDNIQGGTFVTGGAGYVTPKMGLDVGLRKQVDGGDELMVQASLRIFGPVGGQP